MMARWIRLGAMEPHDFEPLYTRLAVAQATDAVPALLWAQAQTSYLFALVAPRKLAPGRATRWFSWAAAPAIATYRQFGLGRDERFDLARRAGPCSRAGRRVGACGFGRRRVVRG